VLQQYLEAFAAFGRTFQQIAARRARDGAGRVSNHYRASHLRRMVVTRTTQIVPDRLALYTMAAALVGYFGVKRLYRQYGLNASRNSHQNRLRTDLGAARLKRERADSEHRISLLRPIGLDPDCWRAARFSDRTTNPHDLVRMTTAN